MDSLQPLSSQNNELFTWQIGSRTPPKVCLCCGRQFTETRERKGPYKGPYIWVCSECWEQPHLFFEDKLETENSIYNFKEVQTKDQLSFPETPISNYSNGWEHPNSYSWFLDGKNYRINRITRPLSSLKFDPSNQRIQFALESRDIDPSCTDQETLEKVLYETERYYINKLCLAIEETNGILEPLIVTADGIVIEGNCRLAALRRLFTKNIDNGSYSEPPCEVLPEDFEDSARFSLIGQSHAAGKRKWKAYEIAAHIYKMVVVLNKSHDEVAKTLRLSTSSVQTYVKAYQMQTKYMSTDMHEDDIYKWSYFWEFQRKKLLVEKSNKDPKFEDRFYKWVRQNKISKGSQVRKLPELIDNVAALKTIDKQGFIIAYQKYGAVNDPIPGLEKAVQELELTFDNSKEQKEKLSNLLDRIRVISESK